VGHPAAIAGAGRPGYSGAGCGFISQPAGPVGRSSSRSCAGCAPQVPRR